MKFCMTTILSIALLLGNSFKLRASVTGPVPSDGDGDGPASQMCHSYCQGPAAIPGIPGLPGHPGQLGPAGSKGDAGFAGEKGDIGPIGPMGERGAPGDDGIGLSGKIGPRGTPGSVGQTGETGVKGEKGEPGETVYDSNERIAFTVTRTTTTDLSSSHDTRLPFEVTKTLLLGTSFDLETGTFTCTVPGTYVFMFSINRYRDNHLYIHLWKNSELVVSGHSYESSLYEQVSASAVVVLQQGDTVYLTMFGKSWSYTQYQYSSFSGFLLYAE